MNLKNKTENELRSLQEAAYLKIKILQEFCDELTKEAIAREQAKKELLKEHLADQLTGLTKEDVIKQVSELAKQMDDVSKKASDRHKSGFSSMSNILNNFKDFLKSK